MIDSGLPYIATKKAALFKGQPFSASISLDFLHVNRHSKAGRFWPACQLSRCILRLNEQ